MSNEGCALPAELHRYIAFGFVTFGVAEYTWQLRASGPSKQVLVYHMLPLASTTISPSDSRPTHDS